MAWRFSAREVVALLICVSAGSLGGCAGFPLFGSVMDDRECLVRAMYFESNRSSDEGLLAVGTVVMNRVASPRYPHTICGVVGQPGQFAQGVLTMPMQPRERDRVEKIADAILAGARHPGVGNAMFFHTAGLTFPYSNMHYVLVAGGNAFYEKVSTPKQAAALAQIPQPPPQLSSASDLSTFGYGQF
jgi:spore germination cell wall hydrolase CwlJ-like protein